MTHQLGKKISVLIVDDIPETRENLGKLLYFESDIEIVGTAEDGYEAIDQAKKLQPSIILMDINMPDMDGISATKQITRVAPATQIIIMSVQSEKQYMQGAMLAGASYFLTKPFTSEELSNAIHHVHDEAKRRGILAPKETHDLDMAAPPDVRARRPMPHQGKLLVVYSPKGGAGCSTLATNLAIALERATSRKVALVDGSFQFGIIDALLDLRGSQSIVDVTERIDELNSELLNVLMFRHPSGIKVLAAPPSPLTYDSEKTNPAIFKQILTQLKKDFDYVLLDTWSYLDDMVLAAIDLAERILLLMTPEIPSIKSTRHFFEIAEALKFPVERIDLIINKVIPRDGIRAEQIEQSMQHQALAQFEFDPKTFRQAVNQGAPLIMVQPNHPLSAGFLKLAQLEVAALEPQSEEDPVEADSPESDRQRRSGLFGRLKK
jgi:pilus assembly protein CpaE